MLELDEPSNSLFDDFYTTYSNIESIIIWASLSNIFGMRKRYILAYRFQPDLTKRCSNIRACSKLQDIFIKRLIAFDEFIAMALYYKFEIALTVITSDHWYL